MWAFILIHVAKETEWRNDYYYILNEKLFQNLAGKFNIYELIIQCKKLKMIYLFPA